MSQISQNFHSKAIAGGIEATKDTLALDGFARFSLPDTSRSFFGHLNEACFALEPDPYGDGQTRFRSYARAMMLPWEDRKEWFPSTIRHESTTPLNEYYQGDFNPEIGDRSRYFPVLDPLISRSTELSDVIAHDFAKTTWSSLDLTNPIQVGVALMRLYTTSETPEAKITPDCLHQDGEHYTFIHLIDRHNVIGGENAIAPVSWVGNRPDKVPRPELLARFTLEHRLDSYGVHDPKVSHHVSGIQMQEGQSEGWRHTLVIDFTPMSPRF